MVPRVEFVSDLSIESGAKRLGSPGRDMDFTVFDVRCLVAVLMSGSPLC